MSSNRHASGDESLADLDDTPRGRLLRQVLFANWGRWLPTSRENEPAHHGEKWPCRIRNLFIENVPDGVKLGTWQFLPEDLVNESNIPPDALFEQALKNSAYPTVLYLHGMGASRLHGHRTRFGWNVSQRNINFVSIDYRGYADSSRHRNPTERGVVRDARAAFDWLVSKGALPGNIVIAGHSLGTGVASSLAAQLSLEGITPRALILVAPYTSIKNLLLTYRPGGKWGLPLLAPLSWVPPLNDYLIGRLNTPFNTVKSILDVHCPIALVHAKDDYEISSTYSQRLFAVLTDQSCQEAGLQMTTSTSETGITSRATSTSNSSGGRGQGAPLRVIFYEANTGGHEDVESAEASLNVMEEVIRGKLQAA